MLTFEATFVSAVLKQCCVASNYNIELPSIVIDSLCWYYVYGSVIVVVAITVVAIDIIHLSFKTLKYLA